MQIEHIKSVQDKRKGFYWRTMQNQVIHISQMRTSHLFNSTKMIYNHMAELIGFPTFWFTKKYEDHTIKWIEQPEKQLHTLKGLVEELETRTDWDESQKDIYQKIRLTLRGQFHSIVFSKLEEMGLDIDTIEMEDPLKLLMEAKKKHERQQLNSSNR